MKCVVEFTEHEFHVQINYLISHIVVNSSQTVYEGIDK